MNKSKGIALLNDLIIINNDRVEGYQTAYLETEEAEMKLLFVEMKEISERNLAELQVAVSSLGGQIEEGTRTSGKFFRFWMDFKATITGNNRGTILDSCEFGEDKVLEEYKSVLENEDVFSAEYIAMLKKQQIVLQANHDRIKVLRDAALD